MQISMTEKRIVFQKSPYDCLMGGEKHGPFRFIAEETCCACAGMEIGQGILPEMQRSRLYLYYAEIDIPDRME